ncbi:MAG: metal ABC transporter ATP-binding protein [Victivallaceae bacterium]
MHDSDIVWSVENFSVKYDGFSVLYNVSFEISRGKLVAIIGPNGAGKSTLLRGCLGFIKPVSGKVRFFHRSLKKAFAKVAYIPQKAVLDWSFPMTVIDFILMGLYGKKGLLGRINAADKREALVYLEKVGLEKEANKQIGKLSGGQQQRAFLGRALMQGAELYLMDEPFAAVDFASFESIMKILQSLRLESKTIVVIHHSLHNVPEYFDEIILLNKRLIVAGPVESCFNEDMLAIAYGGDIGLFDKALELERLKSRGINL